ncbi:hypothetical protein M885DRAFT_550375 [Pelagophyceae sp. CCMP2097]|nr:hypothetical protein M885DRAFT_550375 [Pelagophyceae sp. CCMP2097]
MVGEGVHAAAAAVLRCAVERDAGARAALKDDAAGLLAALEGLLDAAAAPVRECALRTLAALAGGDDFRVDVAASGKVRGRVIDILDEFSAAAALAEARKAVAEGDGTEDDSVKHDALEDDTVEDGSVQRNALEDKDDAVDDAVPRDALEEEEYGAGEGSEEGSASRSTLGEDDSEDDSSASRSEIGEDDAVDDDSVARSALGEEGAVEKGSASRSAVGEGDSEEGGSMDNDSVARSAVGESDAFEDGSVARSALGEEGAVEDSSAVVEEGAVEDGYALIEEDTVDEGSALVEEDAVDEGSALIEQGAAAEGVLGASSLLVGTDAEFEAAARIAFAMASSAEADVGALLQLAECVGRAVECGGAPPGSLRWLADAVSALAARRPAADALASRAPLRHALLAASTARAAPPEIETAWPRHAGRADAVEGTAFAAAFAFAALVRHLPLAAHAVDVVAALAPDDDAWPRRPASQEEHERAAVACLLFGALRGAALAATDAERAGVRESLARGGADVVAAAARARTPARFSARAFLAALAPRTALELDDGDAQTPAAETRVPPCSEDDCEKARAAEDFLERQRIALGMSGVDDEGTARDEGRSADEAIARRGGPEAPPAGAAEARVEPELEPWQRSRTPALEDDDDDEDEASQAASSADGAARRERALNRAGSVAESRAVRRPGCGYDDDDDDDDPELQAALALSARSLVEDEARREAADALADGDDTPSLVRAVSEGTLPAAPPAAADASAAVQSDDREADKHDEAAVARSGSAPRPSDREEEGSPPEAAADDDDEDQKRDDDEHPVLETRDEAGPASPRGDDDDGTDSDDGASSASSASSTQAAPAPPAYAAASDERAPGGPPPARGPPAYEPAKPDSENDSDDDGASDLLAALELSRQATEVEGGGAESSAAVEARGRADAEARGCADARPAERRRPASPGAPPPPPAYDQVCSPKSPAPPPPAAPPTPGGRRAAEPVSPTASPTTRPDAKAKKQKGIRLF